MRRIWVDFLLIALIGAALFARVSSTYFCGYDDFSETRRAVFEDAGNPSRIFTTTHFGTTKYRPLNRLSTFLCWTIGRGSALPFRLRNLFFHLICAFSVYAIALMWTRQRAVALVAGLFFCLDPATNQNVVATVFTNTSAYAFLLTGFLVFLVWTESKRGIWLALSLLLVLIGMFYYEPVIMVFPMMAGYLFLEKWRGSSKAPSFKVISVWFGGSAGVLFVFGLARHFVVHGENILVPFPTMLHNAMLYTGGLLSPIDVVTANQLFGSPLPPEIHIGRKILTLLVIAILTLAVSFLVYLRTPMPRTGIQRLDKGMVAYLTLLIPIVLAPFLLFTPHASETYLYLPAALYCILLSVLLWTFLPSKVFYRSAVAAILVCFVVGTWIRNQRVAACGQTAFNILRSLPVSRWKNGDWYIRLFNIPGETLPPRYGLYAYEGLATIDPGDPDAGNAIRKALQVATGNPGLKAKIVSPAEIGGSCAVLDTCFEVSRSGSVHEVVQTPNQN
jgi:hypothetical protein